MGWRWARDRWDSRGGNLIAYDKVEHFLAHFLGYIGLVHVTGTEPGETVAFLAVAGFLWEIKDALLPWETAGVLGGDGFSWRDLVANFCGFGFAYLLF